VAALMRVVVADMQIPVRVALLRLTTAVVVAVHTNLEYI